MTRNALALFAFIVASLSVECSPAVFGGAPPMAQAAGKALPSWPGDRARYSGRYRLIAASDPSFATAGALTIFSRIVPRVPAPQLSGILSLSTKTDNNVVYLTMFKHTSTKLWASINLGLYTGPVIGQFDVVSFKGTLLKAQFVQTGTPPVTLTFVYFSKNPHP